MDAKIDYLSWTVLRDMSTPDRGGQPAAEVYDVLQVASPVFAGDFFPGQDWVLVGARGHYSSGLFSESTYAAIRWGGSANHVLLEMPGTACQVARDLGVLAAIAQEASPRCTRIDVAVDIPGGPSPRQFVAAGYNGRFKAYAEIVSASGETEYVGSMKSERYARVYMYREPHPRAGVLRVEHVLRADFAKAAAALVIQEGSAALAERLGNTFGWLSPAWIPAGLTDGKLRAKRADRHQPGRVRWLHEIVFHSIIKAHREGLIDGREFVALLLQAIE